MYFLLNRNDRSGSILQVMLYIYSYCFKHNIEFDGLISDNGWWYNDYFFNMVKKYFNIDNKKIKKKSLNFVSFEDIKNYSNIKSNNLYSIFEVSKLCSYFTNNINNYFDLDFRKYIFNKIIKLNYEKKNFIISLHIRRGDVNKNITRRYTNDEVYINVLKKIIKTKKIKNYEIHIFSEKKFNGNIEIYKQFENVKFHLEEHNGKNELTNVFNDILFMINSDYLICSKSSFSYISALLNINGNVYHNNNFWNNPLDSFEIYDDNTGNII